MKNLKIVVLALLLFAVLAGIGYALTPPPPPPPPVNQTIGLYDTSIDKLVTTATDQSACRSCHLTTGTNISGGYNNTIGGVPTRHHSLLPAGTINPLTSAPFGCSDCHPPTPGVGNGILLDRSCVNCHNGTAFWGNGLGGHVGNISRPHHVDTSSDTANIGNPAANRTCNFCHGSFVDNYNDQHYKPTYNTDFMITPFATFKVTNFLQPDGLGGNKTWGGCNSCHLANPNATPATFSNVNNHHREIKGLSSGTFFQTIDTPGQRCNWCHVIDPATVTNPNGLDNTSGSPLLVNITNTWVNPNQLLTNAMELRNTTVESTSALELGTFNITVNGTGCEKCHGVKSLHNINSGTYNSSGGPQGKGHIQNNTDCYGCHNSWLPAAGLIGAIVPTVDSVSPSIIAVNTAVTLTITGSNFVNDVYTSVVTVDGVTYTPTSITDTQIAVNIPALSAGTHKLQLVKGGDTLSELTTLTVVSKPTITSMRLNKGVITITGTGFGTKPATGAQLYVSVNHAGNQITSTAINSWSDTQIKARNSAAAIGDVVTVLTADSGETTATI